MLHAWLLGRFARSPGDQATDKLTKNIPGYVLSSNGYPATKGPKQSSTYACLVTCLLCKGPKLGEGISAARHRFDVA